MQAWSVIKHYVYQSTKLRSAASYSLAPIPLTDPQWRPGPPDNSLAVSFARPWKAAPPRPWLYGKRHTRFSIDPRGRCRNTPRQTNKTMMKTKRSLLRLGLGLCLVGAGPRLHADEGMWLFNDPPKKLLKQRYGFDVTDAWLEHVQKSSVR